MNVTKVPIHKPGFKSLTVDNWNVADPIHALFYQLSPSGMPEPTPPEIWVDKLLVPQLEDNVPAGVRDLFEVARGCCIYGYYFYPLYNLGIEQFYRVAEAALTAKCKALNATRGVTKLSRSIDFLAAEGYDVRDWKAVRHLRNEASHPTFAQQQLPNDAFETMHFICKLINQLFATTCEREI
jgi:hypothetical protein